jgi:hypothetical protein
MKKCKICCKIKSFNEFYKRDKSKNAYRNECKECKSNIAKTYYEDNKDEIKSKTKIYNKENKEKYNQYMTDYKINNKNKIKEQTKIYREKNKEKIKNLAKTYYVDNKDKILGKYHDGRENNLGKMKVWKKNNRDKLSKYQREYYKNRKQNDSLFKLRENVRTLIRQSIKRKGLKKNSKTSIILGCTFEEFKTYLESKFEDWMNWDNYGLYNGKPNYGWDIDHIIPNSSAQTEEDIIRLNHYGNLQPLCSYNNRDIKKNKLEF